MDSSIFAEKYAMVLHSKTETDSVYLYCILYFPFDNKEKTKSYSFVLENRTKSMSRHFYHPDTYAHNSNYLFYFGYI